jgi:acyl-CoA dehydrogenase
MRALEQTDPIQLAATASRQTLRAWACDVDARNRFPHESIDALRQLGLLAYFIPRAQSGPTDFVTYCGIAALLAENCLSTALIWAMHCQQVAILVDHGDAEHKHVLDEVERHGALIASVTTEIGKGGDLLTALAPLVPEGHQVRVRRVAPIVSYAEHAAFFLMTMRSAEDRHEHDVRLVLVTREDGGMTVTGDWNAMGARGTRSVPVRFDLVVDPNRVFKTPFRQIAVQTLIPAAHLGWSAAWYGAARGAFQRFVRQLRKPENKSRAQLQSDLFLSRLADLRVSLDLMDSMINQAAGRIDSLRQANADATSYESIPLNISLNNVKIAVSRLAFEVVDGLVELCGLAQGYMKNTALDIERVFRDLRSATLMYHNDRLLGANGKLILVEYSGAEAIWRRPDEGTPRQET